MITNVTYMAASTVAEEEATLFSALGIDWQVLILQTVAFLVLVWFLGKFVYPHLVKAIDKREKAIEDSVKAAAETEKRAEEAQKDVEALLVNARKEASAIVETAKKESAAKVEEAEKKAHKRADRIIEDARAQLDQDIAAARKELRKETTELVALATEKIVREKVDAKRDSSLIDAAIKEAR